METLAPRMLVPLADLTRLAAIVRDLSPERLEAWLACGKADRWRMPFAEAEALMWRELAATGEA